MIVPVVESDQQAQDPATGVADVVSGAHRHVTDVTSHELFGYRVTHSHVNSHLGRTLERQNRPAEALPHLRMASAMHPSEEYEETVRRVSAKV